MKGKAKNTTVPSTNTRSLSHGTRIVYTPRMSEAYFTYGKRSGSPIGTWGGGPDDEDAPPFSNHQASSRLSADAGVK